jgi:hypothetical protein
MLLEDWVAALATELDLDVDVDVKLLLEVARDAAHHVDRPAAPLTTFLVGYAAGRRSGEPGAVADAAARARSLALGWPAPPDPATPSPPPQSP